ncbi:MAG TPA: DNA-protecting protein DprA, partial [Microbacterium sp.]|nr:DNA-protecting protein DprA [Microbacterium sp.]
MTPPPPREARAALASLVRGELDDERARRLYAVHTWSCLIEPGDGVAGRIVSTVGPEAALGHVVTAASDPGVLEAAGITPLEWREGLARWRPRLKRSAVQDALEVARRSGISLITPEDAHWPAAL